MPIRPFLNGRHFDQETVRSLGLAFELVCITLRTGGSDDYVKQAIADKIIELAQNGERNPDLLCERALEAIRRPPDDPRTARRPLASLAESLPDTQGTQPAPGPGNPASESH
jgi:hypothetical protein